MAEGGDEQHRFDEICIPLYADPTVASMAGVETNEDVRERYG